MKDYCDGYIRKFLENDENEEAFNCLVRLVEEIREVEDDMLEEDYFRPVELITYYLAKTVTLSRCVEKQDS